MSEMTEKGEDFAKVLGKAQAKGYAEADPTLDIEGIDAAHKLTILIRLAYGLDFPMSGLTVKGISKVEQFDISLFYLPSFQIFFNQNKKYLDFSFKYTRIYFIFFSLSLFILLV